MTKSDALKNLEALSRECAVLESIDALLGWDERTMLPTGSGKYRAQQMTYLAGLIHQKRTDPRWSEWLDAIDPNSFDPNSDDAATVKQLRRKLDRAQKQPQPLVQELAEATVEGQQAWVRARTDNDFNYFAPFLQRIVKLKQEQAEAIGYDDAPYDALLDEYEPEATTKEIASVLNQLKDQLAPLVQQIQASSSKPNTQHLHRKFDPAAQKELACMAASKIGFDFDKGRLDPTAHPFCTELGPNDCRITTRYDQNFFNMAFFGVMHEAGHGIYEQGLQADKYGLPSGSYCSLGIHESQSRLWENMVGRSRGFWEHFLPSAQSLFPESLNDVSLDDFYASVNAVEPSLIRVEADEATYNLHIVIRFQLEQQLIHGQLQVKDLPEAWNQAYQETLGVNVPDDANGCLQDVHWSAGLFGYFPTYSLGNLYAAQLFKAAENQIGDFQQAFAAGQYSELRDWLQQKIYNLGQNLSAKEMVEQATGQPLSSDALLDYLKGKLLPIYQL